MKRRVLAFVLCLLLVLGSCPVSAASGTLQIKVGTVTAKPGDTVDVPVEFGDNPGIAGLQIKVVFGSDLTLTGIDYTDSATTGLTSQASGKKTSPVKLTWYSGTTNSTFNGVAAVMHFTVSETCTVEELPLTLDIDEDNVADVTESNVPFNAVNGAIKLTAAATPTPEITPTPTPVVTPTPTPVVTPTPTPTATPTPTPTATPTPTPTATPTPEITPTPTPVVTPTPTPVTEDPAVLTVSTLKTTQGKEVSVDISVKDNPGMAVIHFQITYDKTRLQLVGFTDGMLTDWEVGVGGGEKAIWVSENGSSGDGTILSLTFKVLEDAEDGFAEVSVEVIDIGNVDEVPIDTTVVPGGITVVTRVPGDVTDDGKVNAYDLLRLKKYLAGISTTINELNSDVTGDGKVSAYDVLRLKKYLAAGSSVELK